MGVLIGTLNFKSRILAVKQGRCGGGGGGIGKNLPKELKLKS